MPIKVYLFVLLNNQSNLVMILQKLLVDHLQWIKNNIIYQSFEDIMMTNFLLSIFNMHTCFEINENNKK